MGGSRKFQKRLLPEILGARWDRELQEEFFTEEEVALYSYTELSLYFLLLGNLIFLKFPSWASTRRHIDSEGIESD